MRLGIHEIMKAAAEAKTPVDKANVLRKHNSGALQTVLRYAYDTRIRWVLPEGEPPYISLKKDEWINSEFILLSEARTMYLFVEGAPDSNPNISHVRREQKYIELLEACHPEDAKVVVQAKNRMLFGVSAEVVRMAFPGLISDDNPTPVLENVPAEVKEHLNEKQLAARARKLLYMRNRRKKLKTNKAEAKATALATPPTTNGPTTDA